MSTPETTLPSLPQLITRKGPNLSSLAATAGAAGFFSYASLTGEAGGRKKPSLMEGMLTTVIQLSQHHASHLGNLTGRLALMFCIGEVEWLGLPEASGFLQDTYPLPHYSETAKVFVANIQYWPRASKRQVGVAGGMGEGVLLCNLP